MKFGFGFIGIILATVSAAAWPTAAMQMAAEPFYCPGETKQFIGPDGKFIRPNKDTFLSWPKPKQTAYSAALSRQILRSDATEKAYLTVVEYARTHPLEINRAREDALNKDARLFPFRRGEIDLLRKSEDQMTGEEKRAYLKSLEDFEIAETERLARNFFHADFCSKR